MSAEPMLPRSDRPGPGSGVSRTSDAFIEALRAPGPLRTVELRPPPAGLPGGESVDAWIDLYRTVRALLRDDRFVLFTDDAVGDREEESLQHLTSNLGPGVDLSRVVPFLTCKHTLDYCLLFATRAASHGLGAVTVTGGDQNIGPPRCVPRSRDLRRIVREHAPDLPLGTWVNPYRDPVEQVELLLDPEHNADYYLTQVVSRHDLAPLERFMNEAARRGVEVPGLAGIFFFRSANPKTLERLSQFIPVPAEELTKEFGEGASAEAVCARTVAAMEAIGVEKVYIANLERDQAAERMRGIEKEL